MRRPTHPAGSVALHGGGFFSPDSPQADYREGHPPPPYILSLVTLLWPQPSLPTELGPLAGSMLAMSFLVDFPPIWDPPRPSKSLRALSGPVQGGRISRSDSVTKP